MFVYYRKQVVSDKLYSDKSAFDGFWLENFGMDGYLDKVGTGEDRWMFFPSVSWQKHEKFHKSAGADKVSTSCRGF